MRLLIFIAFLTISLGVCPVAATAQDTSKLQPLSVDDLQKLTEIINLGICPTIDDSQKNPTLQPLSAAGLKKLTEQAENGQPYAQKCLGNMYYSGEGVTQDYDEAYAWYSVAAAQGIDSAAILNSGIPPEKLTSRAQQLSKQYIADYQKRPDNTRAIDHTPQKQESHQQTPAQKTLTEKAEKGDAGAQSNTRLRPLNQPRLHEGDLDSTAPAYFQWTVNFAASFVILIIYLIPPLILRYVFLRRPVGKAAASLLTIMCFLAVNIFGFGLQGIARGYVPPLNPELLAIVPFLGVICAFRILQEKNRDTKK